MTREGGAGLPAATLLAPDEAPAVERWHQDAKAPVLLVCDHASRLVPRALGTLGLAPALFDFHIAWDIGAAEVARLLALQLDAPLILGGYSRLVVDLNRYPDDPSSIPLASDGIDVPGNCDLAPANRARRLDALFHPYHRAIAATLDRLLARGHPPALVSVHSFTPMMAGKARPWHVGVLWDRDDRIAGPLMAGLRAQGDILVGDNEPYSASVPKAYTVTEHAEVKGWPQVAIELRQDLVASAAGAAEWSRRLADALGPILADERLYRAV